MAKLLRIFSKVALASVLVTSMIPAAALAADGAQATEGDAPVYDLGQAPTEGGDKASSWRFESGEPLVLEPVAEPEDSANDESGIMLLSEEGAGSESEDACGIETYASIVPGNGVTFPAGVRRPANATGIGIDVSVHNGVIDWNKVKAAGVQFAILRCGYGLDFSYQDDARWSRNVSECERLGIPYGVYLYSYADSVAQADNEADHVLRLLKQCGKGLQYPVYFDMEESSLESGKKVPLLSEMAMTFCSKISRAGYTPAIYANTNWFTNYLTEPVFDAWGRWVAQYNTHCTYGGGDYQIWQCSSSGIVKGIDGRVDLNYELANSQGKLSKTTGLQMVNGDMVFLANDGSRKTGWQTYKNRTYYFDSNGVMVTGTYNGYYFNKAGALEGRWEKSGNRWYLKDQNNQNKTGWQHMQDKWYYFNPSDGVMQKGWLQQGGSWYWLTSNGDMAMGWVTVEGKKYYLDPKTGRMVTGCVTISGQTYNFDSSGALVVKQTTSWVKSGNKWYLRSSSGQNLTGWQKVGGVWYYMNGSGVMQTGWLKLDQAWYYLNGSGAMQTGWLWLGRTWYYLNPDSGAMAEGWARVSGSWYYLNPGSGAMATGWKKISGKWYYLNGSGARKTGWAWIGGAWYYLTPGSGAMAEGWSWIDNTWYYLYPGSGAMATGWKKISGTWYYLNSSGAMARNRWIGNYYVTDSGAMATNCWIGRYHVNSSGLWDKTR